MEGSTYFCFRMKRIFTLITILISISLIGIIVIQYSWLKNVVAIRKEQVNFKVQEVEYEVVENLVDVKMRLLPAIPQDALPKGAPEELLKMLEPPTLAERFTVEEIQKSIAKSFEDNGLKGAKFQFAVISNSNNTDVDLATPEFKKYYEIGNIDTTNYAIHSWPLVNLSGDEAVSLLPDETLILITYDMQDFVLRSVSWVILAALLFTIIIITAFYLTVRTILTQKKLSEMKTDFINNMTHELRTPLATIAIAVDTLKNEKIIGNREQLLSIGQIIKAENARMNTQVEQILQAAQLDINQVLKDKKPLHVHEVLGKLEDKFALQVAEKNAQISFALLAEKDQVLGHPVHFVNMISNLFDNALKYSKDDVDPVIKVSTKNEKNNITLTVEDNGIGMSKETISRIFDKFFRAHTGNVHNVKGFGLGLNYTRKMVEAHDGSISVQSEIGKGSKFTITIPLH
jgi:two-component system phosphate regulon sensor histidine kinase PhoR